MPHSHVNFFNLRPDRNLRETSEALAHSSFYTCFLCFIRNGTICHIYLCHTYKRTLQGKPSALVCCYEAASQSGWTHADVQLGDSVFICLHSNSSQTVQQDVVLPYLWFGSINFSTNVNQNLTFQMKGGLSGQTAKSLKKDRQINNVQKCNRASGKMYCITVKEEDNSGQHWACVNECLYVQYVLFQSSNIVLRSLL